MHNKVNHKVLDSGRMIQKKSVETMDLLNNNERGVFRNKRAQKMQQET